MRFVCHARRGTRRVDVDVHLRRVSVLEPSLVWASRWAGELPDGRSVELEVVQDSMLDRSLDSGLRALRIAGERWEMFPSEIGES